jgi:hypothetical protein
MKYSRRSIRSEKSMMSRLRFCIVSVHILRPRTK